MRALFLSVWLATTASAHPSSAAHLHATEGVSCADTEAALRRVQALIAESRLEAAQTEIERLDACGATSFTLSLSRANLHLQRHEPEPAIALLDALLRAEPSQPGALLARAQAHAMRGDFALAADDALALARAHPEAADAWLQAADHRTAAGDPDGGFAILDEAIEATGLSLLRIEAASRHAAQHNHDRALALLDAVPVTVPVLIQKAEILDTAHRTEEATRVRQEALRLAQTLRPSPRRTAWMTALQPATEVHP